MTGAFQSTSRMLIRLSTGVRLSICLASLLSLGLASCGEDSASPPVAATREDNGSEPTVPPSSPRDEVTRLSIDIGSGRSAAVLADPHVSDEVKAVLGDGVVTFSEYEASVLGMAQCVKDAGARFRTPDWIGGASTPTPSVGPLVLQGPIAWNVMSAYSTSSGRS
jgi:hypothetical protein